MSAVTSAVGYARRLVRSGKPYAVAIRAASNEYGVSSVDVSTGLRGARKRRCAAVGLPERCTHVPDHAYWQD